MSKIKINYPKGSTPLDPAEMDDLIPDYVTTQQDLNLVEQANIADAFLWSQNISLDDLLTATFIFKLHKKMFDQVWKWSGNQRESNKNIGVLKENIGQDLGTLLGDVKYWIEHSTFPLDEIAIRFHQRLVKIHVFPNGNGRHARLITNLLLKKLGQPPFSWGSNSDPTPLEVEGSTRTAYVDALIKADNEDYSDLLKFSRS